MSHPVYLLSAICGSEQSWTVGLLAGIPVQPHVPLGPSQSEFLDCCVGQINSLTQEAASTAGRLVWSHPMVKFNHFPKMGPRVFHWESPFWLAEFPSIEEAGGRIPYIRHQGPSLTKNQNGTSQVWCGLVYVMAGWSHKAVTNTPIRGLSLCKMKHVMIL